MAAELLKKFEPEIETISLIPSEGGCFEVVVNQTLIFSKLALHRHPENGEVSNLVQTMILHKGSQ